MKYDAQPKKGFSIVDLPNDNFITRIAKDAQEACAFIQVRFDYVIGEYDDGGKIYAIGGYDTNKVLNVVEEYDPSLD